MTAPDLAAAIADAQAALRTSVAELRERLRHVGRADLDALLLPILDRIDPADPMAALPDLMYVQTVLAGGLVE